METTTNKFLFENNLAFAQNLDKADNLRSYREKFFFPQHNQQDVVYFTGNSLGLQPKITQSYLQQELNDWATFGVEGHFLAKNPFHAEALLDMAEFFKM